MVFAGSIEGQEGFILVSSCAETCGRLLEIVVLEAGSGFRLALILERNWTATLLLILVKLWKLFKRRKGRRVPPVIMKLSGWNSRSLVSEVAVRDLVDFQGRVKVDVLFLSESHLDKEKAEVLRRKLGFNFMLINESDGRSGGLVLFSNKENRIVAKDIGPNFIDITIGDCCFQT